MIIRLMIRGFAAGAARFEQRLEWDEATMETLLSGLAEKHASAIAANELDMVEIEFLDEPDVNQRFFRIGTDPSGMRIPVRVL